MFLMNSECRDCDGLEGHKQSEKALVKLLIFQGRLIFNHLLFVSTSSDGLKFKQTSKDYNAL